MCHTAVCSTMCYAATVPGLWAVILIASPNTIDDSRLFSLACCSLAPLASVNKQPSTFVGCKSRCEANAPHPLIPRGLSVSQSLVADTVRNFKEWFRRATFWEWGGAGIEISVVSEWFIIFKMKNTTILGCGGLRKRGNQWTPKYERGYKGLY